MEALSSIAAKHGDLTLNEALSGVFGSISLAAWIFLLIPQLIENYRLQSADGISLLFLSVWFIGDVTNLIGASWSGLVPTVIALAVYFCFADTILILQCIYYNHINARRNRRKSHSHTVGAGEDSTPSYAEIAAQGTEHEPLIRATSHGSQHSIGLPGSHRRRPSAASSGPGDRSHSFSQSALAQIVEEEGDGRGWVRNTVSVALVCLAGAVGWAIAYKSGVWKPTRTEHHKSPGHGNDDMGDLPMVIGGQILGYVSAIAYLGARIPQIVKNQRERSCEGLSLLFFILSLLGNATYGAGILSHSTEKSYIMTNLPWLIGSIGTMSEDVFIFIQFHTFRRRSSDSEAITA